MLRGSVPETGDAGLKLKPAKCRLFQKSIKYLGHVVSEHGVPTDPDKVAAGESLAQAPEHIRSAKFPWVCVLLSEVYSQVFQGGLTSPQIGPGSQGRQGQKKQQVKNLPFCWGARTVGSL